MEISAQQALKAPEQIQTSIGVDAEDDKVIGSVGKAKVQASCPNCHSPLESNAKFCANCGFKLAENTACKNCGAKLAPGAKFCPECGTKQ